MGIHISKSATGRYYFVGSVPLSLLYVRKSDGGVPTTEEVNLDHRMPGAPKFRKLALRTFDSHEDALAAAKALGVEVVS